MPTLKHVAPYFERLTGEKSHCNSKEDLDIKLFESGSGIGFSQFNEILLLLGFQRIEENFYQYIATGNWKFYQETSISSISQLEEGIDRFLKLALISYGNIRFAYKIFSSNSDVLKEKIFKLARYDIEEFKGRHAPLIDIEEIPADKTYYLGYIIERELNEAFKKDPNSEEIKNMMAEREDWIEVGKKNQTAYLASDHLDVYVATSMRLPHEYVSISQIVNQIFKSNELQELELRWFDPTQAYCKQRIDKGLSEALMLKRASCTLYLAQETDTLGKDSELASTLAQGKPVIAYVPEGDSDYVDNLLNNLKVHNPNKEEKELIIDQMKIFDPLLAWEDEEIQKWINNLEEVSVTELKTRLYVLVKEYYDKRADTLKNSHPLGIQVNLSSGVANGVIVARKINDCIKLIRRVVLNDMEFEIENPTPNDPNGNIYLKEKITKSIFRLKTSDILLSNAFWNFYI